MSDEMIDRARRIVRHSELWGPDEVRLAEALVAEHARAERYAGSHAAAVAATARAVQAERRLADEREDRRRSHRRTLEAGEEAVKAERRKTRAAEARAADLEAALWEYGRHKGGCAYRRRHTRPGRPKRDGRCDCGLDAVLAGGSDES